MLRSRYIFEENTTEPTGKRFGDGQIRSIRNWSIEAFGNSTILSRLLVDFKANIHIPNNWRGAQDYLSAWIKASDSVRNISFALRVFEITFVLCHDSKIPLQETGLTL